MAHFAKLNANNMVEHVIVVDNSVASDESTGQAFIASLGLDGVWKQTSYNTDGGVHYNQDVNGRIPSGKPHYRGNYACMGMVYDEEHDAFIWPKPSPTAVLNTTTFTWEEPTAPAAPTA
jgi:hypothetical protein